MKLCSYVKMIVGMLMLVSLTVNCRPGAEIAIPQQSDWSAPQEVAGLSLGPPGAWDDSDPGAVTPSTVVKRDGIYYLYYVGSDGQRASDQGPTHRKLGLATSTNGIDFIKYAGNPILSWSPAKNEEEGIFGAKALLVDDVIHLYLNTMSATDAGTEQVWADVHLVTSSDGKNFSPPVLVLDHRNPEVVGYGDELGPTGIMQQDGIWSLYYFAKGVVIGDWRLCLATGASPSSLQETRLLIDEPAFFGAGGDINWLAANKIAMFFQKRNDWGRIEVYTAAADSPGQLTRVRTWDGLVHGEGMTVFLDHQAGQWFMYNRIMAEDSKVYVRTAPVKYEPAPAEFFL